MAWVELVRRVRVRGDAIAHVLVLRGKQIDGIFGHERLEVGRIEPTSPIWSKPSFAVTTAWQWTSPDGSASKVPSAGASLAVLRTLLS